MLCIVRQGFAEIPHSRKASLSHSHFRQLKFIIRNGKNRLHVVMALQLEVSILLLIGNAQQRETSSVLSEIVNLIGEERKHKEKAVHKQGILSGAWQIQIVLFVKWEAWSSNGRYASSLLQTFNRIYHSGALTCVALPSLFAYHSFVN